MNKRKVKKLKRSDAKAQKEAGGDGSGASKGRSCNC